MKGCEYGHDRSMADLHRARQPNLLVSASSGDLKDEVCCSELVVPQRSICVAKPASLQHCKAVQHNIHCKPSSDNLLSTVWGCWALDQLRGLLNQVAGGDGH